MGAIITAAINFLIIAGVVYFMIVLPMRDLEPRRRQWQGGGAGAHRRRAAHRDPGPVAPAQGARGLMAHGGYQRSGWERRSRWQRGHRDSPAYPGDVPAIG